VHSFHVQQATAETVRNILVTNVFRKSDLHTDESRIYTTLGAEFAAHNTVNHRSQEYVRGTAHTNTIENVWSVFKRGMKGVYQHCGEAHLHRYLAEFDFRYNTRAALKISDRERTGKIMEGIEGKRLTYRRIGEAQNA
jgi:ISXO2-like transposase domain